MSLPRYPVYIPSRSRFDSALTAKFMVRDGVPFRVVVEAEQRDDYAKVVGEDRLLVLPESNQGLIYARNWIKAHAIEEGHARHWQFDDNIGQIRRLYHGERIPCDAGPAIRSVEDFVDRYSNVAIAGMNYQMFVTPASPAYRTNVHVYSATLVDNRLPYRWRLRYNDDTDICLQVLADGYCTVLVNVFMVDKKTTMTVKGGNTDAGGPIDYQGDGRLRMARALEQAWPGLVTVDWRYGRPQHVVPWGRFTHPLVLRDEVDLSSFPEVDEYGLELRALRPVADQKLRGLLDHFASVAGGSKVAGPADGGAGEVPPPEPAIRGAVRMSTNAPELVAHTVDCRCDECEHQWAVDVDAHEARVSMFEEPLP